jgi:hypothetical protein
MCFLPPVQTIRHALPTDNIAVPPETPPLSSVMQATTPVQGDAETTQRHVPSTTIVEVAQSHVSLLREMFQKRPDGAVYEAFAAMMHTHMVLFQL